MISSRKMIFSKQKDSIFPLTLWSAALMLSVSVVGAQEHEESCNRLALDFQVSSIRSAVWTAESSEIVITDPLENRLLILSPKGKLKKILEEEEGNWIPSIVSYSDGGYIQITTDNESIPMAARRFDAKAAERAVVPLVKSSDASKSNTDSGYKMLALYDWTVAGDQIFAYGAFGTTDQDFQLGFFRYRLNFPPGDNSTSEIHLVSPFADYDYYILGNSYMASIGAVVYFLEMGKFPVLYRYDTRTEDDPVPLRGLSIENEPLPALSTINSPHLLGEIEDLDMPAGLFSQGQFLYLLRRKPARDGLLWSLTQIKQKPPLDAAVEVCGTVPLPTRADHLTLLPAPTSWFVFEKFSLGSEGMQDISTMLAIPAAWIEDPGYSPLLNARQMECKTGN
ncbi:MAG: hypothetical protein GY835_03580 [bacterium]|nr:hypothetical protein [bacterium]